MQFNFTLFIIYYLFSAKNMGRNGQISRQYGQPDCCDVARVGDLTECGLNVSQGYVVASDVSADIRRDKVVQLASAR